MTHRIKRATLFALTWLSLSLGPYTPIQAETDSLKESPMAHIVIHTRGDKIVYALNDSQAAKDLLAQLPLEIKVEDYGSMEKIFYPPQKLNTSGTPLAQNNDLGTLAYYAPWGDVVMFYKKFGAASGLYKLGEVVSGSEHITTIATTVRIEKAE